MTGYLLEKGCGLYMNVKGQNSEQKHETKKLVEFHNQLYTLTKLFVDRHLG